MNDPSKAICQSTVPPDRIFIVRHKRWAEWSVVLLIAAAMPFVHAVATWDSDGILSQENRIFRLYSLPVVIAQITILIFALHRSWRPASVLSSLSLTSKTLLALFVTSISLNAVFISPLAISSSIFLSLKFVVQIAVLGAVVFAIYQTLNFDLEKSLLTVSVSGVAYVLLLTGFCLQVQNPAIFQWIERLPSATNIRQIGNVCAMMLLAPICALLFTSSARVKIAAFVAVLIILTFIAWSGTRAALLALVAALLLTSCVSKAQPVAGNFKWLITACLVSFGLSLIIPTPGPHFGLFRIASSLSAEDISSGRWKMWQDTLEAITVSPYWGHGSGSYRDNMAVLNGYPFNHPHNFALQFAYDWGIVGALPAFGLVMRLGYILWRERKAADQRNFLANCAYVSLFTMGLVEGTLFHPLPMLLAIILIAPELARTRSHTSALALSN